MSKAVVFAKEQLEIANKLYDILELDDEDSITLYKLDHDKELQNKITSLQDDVLKYFTLSNIIKKKHPAKRPYLQIIKHVLKIKYDMIRSHYINDSIHTQRYKFVLKQKTNT